MKPWLLAIASGLALALALPQAIPWISLQPIDPGGHLEWLAWVGLVPAVLAVEGANTWRRALALGLAAGLAYFYAAIWWVNHAMTAFGDVSFPVALLGLSGLVLYAAAHWALAFVVSWTIRRRLGWPWWSHLPAVWVGTELLRNYLFTGFPWGNLGYLQARHLAVAQLAAATGVYGIAALVVLVNCTVAAVVSTWRARGPLPLRLVGGTAAILVIVVASGLAHLAAVRARADAAPRLRVGLVQGNVNQSVKNQGPRYADVILGRYVPLTLQADRQGVDLVAWPEAAYPFLVPTDIQDFGVRGSGLPQLQHAHLLLGAPAFRESWSAEGRRHVEGSNSVFLLRPDLTVVGRYAKHHLVPFGEYVPLRSTLGRLLRSVVPAMVQQEPGSVLRVLDLRTAPGATPIRLAPMICFDAIFPEINVAFAEQDPDVLFNPTNDAWYGYSSGPHQFLTMVAMRAIEAGKAVARPAYAGVTAVIDPTGAIRPGALPVGPVDPDLAPDPDEPPRLLVADLPRLHGRTLYTRVGDLFAGVASVYGVVLLAVALLRRRAPRPQHGASG